MSPLTGQLRLALVEVLQLKFAGYSNEAPESVFAAWSLANVIDAGEIIYFCFQMGSQQIAVAIEAGDASAELGVRLTMRHTLWLLHSRTKTGPSHSRAGITG